MKRINYIIVIFCLQKFIVFGQGTTKKDSSATNKNDTTIYTVVPTMPAFGQTKTSLQEFIKNESKLPTSLQRTSTSKNVFVQIIIEKTGKVTFDKISKSPDDKFSKEAKRIVQRMPNWSVGKLDNGIPARVYLMFPIWFE